MYQSYLGDGPQIRLLALRNQQVREQYDRAETEEYATGLECDLDVFELHERSGPERRRGSAAHGATLPGFVALSYAWAEDNRQQRVSVNGISLDVSGNLNSCLEALGTNTIFRDTYRVWADAICIDQGNITERNREVARMREVYRASSRIVIWLGRAAESSDLAMEFIGKVAHHWGRGRMEVRTYLRSVIRQRGVELFLALSRLIERSYWYRTWVIQELACGDEDTLILCGNRTALWGDFFLTYSSFRPYKHSRRTDLSMIFQEELQQADNQVLGSYEDNVLYYEWNKCDELAEIKRKWPQMLDKVYGILGLFERAIRERIIVDYSLPFTEVYLMFARAYAEAGNGLKVLLESGHEHDVELDNDGMPSWVPDLRFQQRHLRGNDEPEYNAHGGVNAKTHRVTNHSTLRVEGIMVDVIDGVTSQLFWEETANDLQPSASSRSVYGGYEATCEALWRALLGDRNLSGSTPDLEYRCILHSALLDTKFRPLAFAKQHNMAGFAENVHHFLMRSSEFKIAGRQLSEYFRSQHSPADELDPSWAQPEPSATSRPYIRAVRRCREFMYARRLVTTAKGYIAVAPYKALSGDRIAVLFGCSCPMVLRPASNGFKVVCACYVQGLMEGQAIDILHAGKLDANVIDLI
ncbi:hypothetical protein LTR10_005620 [Elasticomyces elasticus]|nr:hypothetical protein LTR10_005620 [Elasticomyces elasticus]